MKKYRETIYQYEVMFNPNGAGYTVTVPKLPGLVTEGDNLREARIMAKEAIRCHIEGLLKDNIMGSGTHPMKKERVSVAV